MRFRFVICVAFVMACILQTGAIAQNREKLESKIVDLKKKLRDKEADFLSPSDEDKAAFATFLSQPDTGIIRLMPREKYDGLLLIRGGGAYYSFARLDHEYNYGSDIELDQKGLSVGFAGADFGFMTSLGNVPLDSVSLDSPAVQFLSSFTAPAKEPEAREQQRRTSAGFEASGFAYKDRLPAELKTTYAVRSISYSSTDVLVAFRTVRQDADGSIVLVWKILKRFPKPELAN